MALSNPPWGEKRTAKELLPMLCIHVSPRIVRQYIPDIPPCVTHDQRWSTFVRNHADSNIACDFFTVVTITFQIRFVFIVIEHRTRRILHFSVTAHPTAPRTLHQLREAIPAGHHYQYLIHDPDCIFLSALDQSLANMGVEVLLTLYRAPQANCICERVIGAVLRECLDFFIPLTTRHLLGTLKTWAIHYNRGRPHASIDPSIPDPPDHLPASPQTRHHIIPEHWQTPKQYLSECTRETLWLVGGKSEIRHPPHGCC